MNNKQYYLKLVKDNNHVEYYLKHDYNAIFTVEHLEYAEKYLSLEQAITGYNYFKHLLKEEHIKEVYVVSKDTTICKIEENIGHCGLDCNKCETFIATILNNDSLRKLVAAKWSKLNNVDIPYTSINCLGCNSNTRSIYCESICLVRKCALSNSIDRCDKCINFNKCDKVKPYLDNEINILNK